MLYNRKCTVGGLLRLTFSFRIKPFRSIHLVCNDSLFLSTAKQRSAPGMHHTVFNHSPTERRLGCLQFGAMMNKTAVTFVHRLSYEHKFPFLWDRCPRAQTLVVCCGMVSFLKKLITVFQSWAGPKIHCRKVFFLNFGF